MLGAAFERIKMIFSVVGNVRLVLTAAGVGVALVAPPTFRQLPTTTVIAKVTRPQAASGQPSLLNLNVIIKCFAESSRACSSDVLKFRFPGVGAPQVSVPQDLRQNIRGPAPFPEKDGQGRSLYELQILRPLGGGDTIVINVAISGRVTDSDLRLETIRGIDALRSKFTCRENPVDPPDLSQTVCDEKFPFGERLWRLLAFR